MIACPAELMLVRFAFAYMFMSRNISLYCGTREKTRDTHRSGLINILYSPVRRISLREEVPASEEIISLLYQSSEMSLPAHIFCRRSTHV